MPSFDIVSEVDKNEVRNAVDQSNKEVSTRYDFKGSDARIESGDKTLTLFADSEFQLDQVNDILTTKLAKRGVDVRCMEYGKLEKGQRQQGEEGADREGRPGNRPGQEDREAHQGQAS